METLQIISLIISGLTILTMLLAFGDKIFRKGGKEKNIEDRVINLEEKANYDSNELKSIKENHLAHIERDIGDIKVNLGEINTAIKFIIKDK